VEEEDLGDRSIASGFVVSTGLSAERSAGRILEGLLTHSLPLSSMALKAWRARKGMITYLVLAAEPLDEGIDRFSGPSGPLVVNSFIQGLSRGTRVFTPGWHPKEAVPEE
jgi:hypothetical protein